MTSDGVQYKIKKKSSDGVRQTCRKKKSDCTLLVRMLE